VRIWQQCGLILGCVALADKNVKIKEAHQELHDKTSNPSQPR
jgi:hypothetical protein